MSTPTNEEPFYIGYLPKAPAETAAFVRRLVIAIVIMAVGIAGVAAMTLPFFGDGVFEFGRPSEIRGVVRCDAPRLETATEHYLLVGYGKNGVAPEICGAVGNEVVLKGNLIRREGKKLLEVVAPLSKSALAPADIPPVPLGRFTLRGEIVDSKCYFGVMNPAEGRAHRACAELCLRGGVPAVFVARDRRGATAHLIITGVDGTSITDSLLRWVGEPVEASGEVLRQGKWLVWRVDPTTLRRS